MPLDIVQDKLIKLDDNLDFKVAYEPTKMVDHKYVVREDTGVVLAGIALWLGVKQPQRRPLATAMFLVGVSWVVIVTNVLMPMFGDDNLLIS